MWPCILRLSSKLCHEMPFRHSENFFVQSLTKYPSIVVFCWNVPAEVGMDIWEAVVFRKGEKDAGGAAAFSLAAEAAVANASAGRALPLLTKHTHTKSHLNTLKGFW